jgi:hypothetical protein
VNGIYKNNEDSFRNRLIKAYIPDSSRYLETLLENQLNDQLWCPVSGNTFDDA